MSIVLYPVVSTIHSVFFYLARILTIFLRSPSNDIGSSRSNKMRTSVVLYTIYTITMVYFCPAVLGREMASIKYQFDTLGAFFPRPRSLEHSISISNTCISAILFSPLCCLSFLRVSEKCLYSLQTFGSFWNPNVFLHNITN